MELDPKYIFKVRPDVNSLPAGELYVIRTADNIEDSLHITVGQYRELRDLIITRLQAFYTRTEYKDADILTPYLAVRGYIDNHICMQVFHIKEWLIYQQEGIIEQKITNALDWGRWNYERACIPSSIWR